MRKIAKSALPFVKVYMTRMASSSLWEERLCVRVLFLYLLGIADEDGVVLRHTPSALARLANMEQAEVEYALERLTSPDPHSRTPAEEGRRLLELPEGGWRVVNARAYREMQTPKQAMDAARQRKRRGKRSGPMTKAEREVHAFDVAAGNKEWL